MRENKYGKVNTSKRKERGQKTTTIKCRHSTTVQLGYSIVDLTAAGNWFALLSHLMILSQIFITIM
jgi:hypothetical protein